MFLFSIDEFLLEMDSCDNDIQVYMGEGGGEAVCRLVLLSGESVYQLLSSILECMGATKSQGQLGRCGRILNLLGVPTSMEMYPRRLLRRYSPMFNPRNGGKRRWLVVANEEGLHLPLQAKISTRSSLAFGDIASCLPA